VLRNIEFLGLDFLIPIGGDDTLSYAQRLHEEGVKVVAIPKTMDNDVPGSYDTVPITIVTGQKKVVDVEKYYNVERLRPKYESFLRQPLFIMTSDV
jgi:6-phosphofructokinase